MTIASVLGRVLGGAFASLGRVRPSDKPLHPRGVVLYGTLHRRGSNEAFGVPWLDEPGTDEALVRFSRGAGLPPPLPDVLGLAVRIDIGGRPADLLFATAGRGVLGRFVLYPRLGKAVSHTSYSTLQPYRTPAGPVVIGATPQISDSKVEIRLSVARPTGPWHDFGSVVVGLRNAARDEPVSFDPILNEIPGLPNYRWVSSIRAGAYRAARGSRERRECVNAPESG